MKSSKQIILEMIAELKPPEGNLAPHRDICHAQYLEVVLSEIEKRSKPERSISFTIIGIIPSKKNNKQIRKRRNGKPFIASSDEYHIWEDRHVRDLSQEMRHLGNFRGYENLNIDYLFRVAPNKDGTPCRKRWDITNKIESINDMIVKAKLIDDDCHTVLRSMSCRVIDADISENEVVVTISKNTPTS